MNHAAPTELVGVMEERVAVVGRRAIQDEAVLVAGHDLEFHARRALQVVHEAIHLAARLQEMHLQLRESILGVVHGIAMRAQTTHAEGLTDLPELVVDLVRVADVAMHLVGDRAGHAHATDLHRMPADL